jgi:hypothetical protein
MGKCVTKSKLSSFLSPANAFNWKTNKAGPNTNPNELIMNNKKEFFFNANQS